MIAVCPTPKRFSVGAVTLVAVLLAAAVALAAGRELLSTEVKALLARDKKTVLLDVRTPEEYRQAHLRDALLIPVGELERRAAEVPKGRTVVVYCAVGSRSRAAADILSRKGYGDVVNMRDGIMGWFRNGLPVEK